MLLPGAKTISRWSTGKSLASADQVIVDAASMIERTQTLAKKKVPVELIPFGINTDLFHLGYKAEAGAMRAAAGIPSGTKVMLSIRGWNPHYNQSAILDAFEKARPSFTQDVHMVFKRFSSAPEIRALQDGLSDGIKKRGLAEHATMIDEVPTPEMPWLYNFADAVINFPDLDAFPVSFMEAAACEKPVISSRLPAYQGTFAEKYFDMVEPGDVDGLARAMIKRMNEPEDHFCLEKARQEVIADYDESVSWKKLETIYRRLSNRT
jgi:glycosyltransferase involved in cell wall biosynthesis